MCGCTSPELDQNVTGSSRQIVARLPKLWSPAWRRNHESEDGLISQFTSQIHFRINDARPYPYAKIHVRSDGGHA